MYKKYKKLIILSCIINNIFADFNTFVQNMRKIEGLVGVTMFCDKDSDEKNYIDHEPGCNNVQDEKKCSCQKETHDIDCCFEACSPLCESGSNQLLKLYLLNNKYQESEKALQCRGLRNLDLFIGDVIENTIRYKKDGSVKAEDTFFTNPLLMKILEDSYNKNLTEYEKNFLDTCYEEQLKFFHAFN